MKYLILDYETRSEADLKKVGSFNYACHPTTEILCVAWKLVDSDFASLGKTKCISPLFRKHWDANIEELLNLLLDPEVTMIAHNAMFEQVITRFVLPWAVEAPRAITQIPHSKWICTASMAAAMALPRALEKACNALDLPVEKDMEGHRLMMKMSKPRRATKNNSAKWHESKDDLKRLMLYCARDIVAEHELLKTVPMLSPYEREVWLLDQEMNFRGFYTDQELVKTALDLIKEESQLLNDEVRELSNGSIDSIDKVAQIKKWLGWNGAPLSDLTKGSIQAALEWEDMPPKARRMLELRALGAKASTKKYQAFKARAGADWRVRDIVMYHGASTGRWSGMGVQPHNFTRGTIKNYTKLVEDIMKRDLDLLRMLYGSPLEALSSALRPVICAPKGKELFAEDFNAIEARVLLWLAGDEKGLDVYRRGEDAYRIMAALIYQVPLEEILIKGDPRRDGIGKRAELGCGFAMGWKKFLDSAAEYNIKDIDAKLAKRAVQTYRDLHKPVVKMWSMLEKASMYAVNNPGKKVTVCKTSWFVRGEYLFAELPSGRRLAYRKPFIKMKETSWGEVKPTLHYWAVNPKTKKWEIESTYGGKLAENVTQATARDFMVEAKFRLRSAGYEVLLSVHDEIISEKANGDYDEYQKLMRIIPEWGKGCPIKTEGWRGLRYHK